MFQRIGEQFAAGQDNDERDNEDQNVNDISRLHANQAGQV